MDDELRKKLLMEEINLLLQQLRELGFKTDSSEVVDLEIADLREIRRQLRGTLQILGGGR